MEKPGSIREKVSAHRMMPAAILAVGLTVGCTGGEASHDDAQPKPKGTDGQISVCQAATRKNVSKYTSISSADLSKPTCVSDAKAGVLGQQRWTFNVGETTTQGELVTTLVQEDAAKKMGGFSFAALSNNSPATLKQQHDVAGKPREMYISDNGVAVSLGELTLAISIEPAGAASAKEVAPVTLDPAFHSDGAENVASTLADYLDHMVEKVQEN